MAKANSSTEDTLSARKRKLEDIMINEPKRVTRYPILLSSTRPNNDIASNFFDVWLDDKYQEDLVYCEVSRKIIARYKRDNSNLMRHLKTFNRCNTALRVDGQAPRQKFKRDRESTCSTSEQAPKVNTGGEEGASAASECETGSTSTTDSISPTPLPELEPNSFTSTYHIEAAPSDANLAASRNTEEEQIHTSPVLPSLLLEAAPLQAALLSSHSLGDHQYGLDSEDEEPEVQRAQTDPDPHSSNSDKENGEAKRGQMGGGRSKRTQFKEIACRSTFHESMLCKTFEPVEVDADLLTIIPRWDPTRAQSHPSTTPKSQGMDEPH